MVQMEILDHLASRVGLFPAVLLMKVRAWTRTNERNGQQPKDGRYWMYNSITAWHELVPYMSEKQIRTAMQYLRTNGYLLAEKAKKRQWNQTLHYALSDYAIDLFQELESENAPGPMETPHASNGGSPPGKTFSPDRDVDLPSQANDANALPNPVPCNDTIPSPPFPEAFDCAEEVSPNAFGERLRAWNITESEMHSFLQRTGRPAVWAYRWLKIMAEDIRSGHVSEYRSPLGALMNRHKENWPFPRAFNSADLPETKKLQKRVEAARRNMLKEYESLRPDPASPFLKIHKKYAASVSI